MLSPRRFSTLGALLGVVWISGLDRGRAQAPGDNKPGDDPRLGGETGKFRYRISRGPSEEVEVPDVITLKDGRKLEAYFLNIYGDSFVFYVKETERSWLREVVSRSDVAAVDFHQYLDEDPVAPKRIEAARKQPVAQDDFLSGVFAGAQGRHTRWKLTFQSEIDQVLDYTEDATDYGAVELESTFSQRAGNDVRSHEVHRSGKYYLFAPGTIHNQEWVLLLSEVVEREVDRRGQETSLFTTVIPDENFVLYFSPERDSFQLRWSNLGAWAWSSLTQVTFQRLPDEAPLKESFPPTRREILPPLDRGSERRSLPPPRTQMVDQAPGASARGLARAQKPAGDWRLRRWRVEGWKPPRTYWSE
jgi:hypothetical protein